MSDLKNVIKQINKKHGDNTINFAKDMTFGIERISSGSLSLDYILGQNSGVYGWPMKRVVELYGKWSSGKSLISLLTIAEAQKKGISCIYLDAEKTFDADFATSLGVDMDKLIYTDVSIGEDAMDLLTDVLHVQDPMVIVVDSVASLLPVKEEDESMEQQNIALTARLMSKALRKITALNKSALVLLINQIRTNIGTYGNPETATGGNAIKHYASIRVEVRSGEPLRKGKIRMGQTVKFKVVKNKTSAPFMDGYFKYFYKSGIDRVDELVTIGLLNDKIKQAGAYYEIAGEKIRGRDALEEKLKKEDKFFEKVKSEIL